MTPTPTAAEESRLAAKARVQGTRPEAHVRQAIEPVIVVIGEHTASQPQVAGAHGPISRAIADIMKDAPPEELELPKDGASEHDHYIYGWPKRLG